MNRREGDLAYGRLRAPRHHAATLIQPPLNSLIELVRENYRASTSETTVLDTSLVQLSQQARRQLRSDCGSSGESDSPVIMSGHQPELFHPGVWFKSFALARLAEDAGAIGVNMVVDNDLCRSPAIRCPRERNGVLRVETVAYDSANEDAGTADSPYEDRRIQDSVQFRSFGDRIVERICHWVDEPVVERLWPETNTAPSCAASSLNSAWRLRFARVAVSSLRIASSSMDSANST